MSWNGIEEGTRRAHSCTTSHYAATFLECIITLGAILNTTSHTFFQQLDYLNIPQLSFQLSEHKPINIGKSCGYGTHTLLTSRNKLHNQFQVTFLHHTFCYLLWNNCEHSLLTFEQLSLYFSGKNCTVNVDRQNMLLLKNFTGQLQSKACQPASSI